MQLSAATAGAFTVLVVMLMLGRRSDFSPELMLFTGVAIGSVFSAIVALLMASGDPRMGNLLSWMAGSTYGVTGHEAIASMLIAITMLTLTARYTHTMAQSELRRRHRMETNFRGRRMANLAADRRVCDQNCRRKPTLPLNA